MRPTPVCSLAPQEQPPSPAWCDPVVRPPNIHAHTSLKKKQFQSCRLTSCWDFFTGSFAWLARKCSPHSQAWCSATLTYRLDHTQYCSRFSWVLWDLSCDSAPPNPMCRPHALVVGLHHCPRHIGTCSLSHGLMSLCSGSHRCLWSWHHQMSAVLRQCSVRPGLSH